MQRLYLAFERFSLALIENMLKEFLRKNVMPQEFSIVPSETLEKV